MNVFLCVSIDCECDKGPAWRCQKPLAFGGIRTGIQDRLQPVFRHFHAKPTYLFSPEVLRDAACVETLTTLEGDAEFGAHLHGEFAEPGAFEPDVTSTFQRDYDPETERAKLRYLTGLFRSVFGRSPLSFRAGRFGIGPLTLKFLRDLGYGVDSSVTPHMDWARAGAPGLCFRGAPTQPYWPKLSSPAVPDTAVGDIFEVPVTIRPSRLSNFPVIGRWIEPRWLRPTRASAARLIDVAKEEIMNAQAFDIGRPTVLNCMFHNVEVVPGASPYAASEAEAKAILDRLVGLLAFAQSENIGVIGLSDVPELFGP
jgi:hypothetical protein